LDDTDLATLPLLQQATRPSLWLNWFVDGGLDPRSILRGARFQHFDMVIHAAIAGYGVALVPEVLVRAELASGKLLLASQRRLRGPEPYALLYPPRSQELNGFMRFRTWLAAEAEQMTSFRAGHHDCIKECRDGSDSTGEPLMESG